MSLQIQLFESISKRHYAYNYQDLLEIMDHLRRNLGNYGQPLRFFTPSTLYRFLFDKNHFDPLFKLYKNNGRCDEVITKQFYNMQSFIPQLVKYAHSVQVLQVHQAIYDSSQTEDVCPSPTSSSLKKKTKKGPLLVQIGAQLQQKLQAIRQSKNSPKSSSPTFPRSGHKTKTTLAPSLSKLRPPNMQGSSDARLPGKRKSVLAIEQL